MRPINEDGVVDVMTDEPNMFGCDRQLISQSDGLSSWIELQHSFSFPGNANTPQYNRLQVIYVVYVYLGSSCSMHADRFGGQNDETAG